MKSLRFVVTILAVLVIMTAPALAWQVNQHYHNNTGQDAHNITKIILGQVNCTDTMMNQPFDAFDQMWMGPFTFFHWYDTTGDVVPHCSYAHCCFSTSAPTVPPFVAFWTDADGNIIDIAGPVARPGIEYDPITGTVVFRIGNDWHEWTGAGWPPQEGDTLGNPVGPIDILDAKYQWVDEPLELEDLDSSLLGVGQWNDLAELIGPVASGAERIQVIEPDRVAAKKYIVMFFSMIGDGKEGYDVVVKEALEPKVPSMTNYGLIALLALIILTTVVVVWRRRRVTA